MIFLPKLSSKLTPYFLHHLKALTLPENSKIIGFRPSWQKLWMIKDIPSPPHTHRVLKVPIFPGKLLPIVQVPSQSTVCTWVSNHSLALNLAPWPLLASTVGLAAHVLFPTCNWAQLTLIPLLNQPSSLG